MNKDFTTVMMQKSNEELIEILTVHKDDYQSEAVVSAAAELKKRNLSLDNEKAIQEEIEVENKQQSEVESKVVSSMLRLVHLVVDSIIYIILYFIIAGIINVLLGGTDQVTLGFISFILLIVLYFAYYIVLEVKLGKTLGKMLTKTKVVKSNGESPSSTDIFIRTLCRLIPFDQISYVFTKNGFHDYLSNTIVVKDKS
ncbi:RDD family protein [Labilibacter marinus]|uniref:RDD family protein n=1 Tax=Labilibacter marinus TaxID=1477105 RepID=UPI000836B248|nr:RDD family protein [Labilibacter marinus]